MQTSYYLGYSALKDFFPSAVIRPNPECTNAACRRAQQQQALLGPWLPQVSARGRGWAGRG